MLNYFGRKVIYTDTEEITRNNVVSVLSQAWATHCKNRSDIQYLYNYYKGKQPILQRVKEFRQEINNRIVENRANEIVSFKVGYLMGEPVQYVSRGSEESTSEAVLKLNDYVFSEDKAAKDKELADWFTICGTAFRMVLPKRSSKSDQDAPFSIYTLDPRNTFVVYHNGLGNRPVMGVYFVVQSEQTVFCVYTKNKYFEISLPMALGSTPIEAIPTEDLLICSFEAAKIEKEELHIYGDIPIVEYPSDTSRLGAFEIVLPLLDALNTVSSNRLDGIEQFVQSILAIKGIDIESDGFNKLRELGGLLLPTDGDAFYLTQELNQTQTQTLVNYIHQTILDICGMPNRNGGSSTSDTGSAVIMRDGWSNAESRAKDTEMMFKLSEKRSLRLMLEYVKTYKDIPPLGIADIDIRFTRRNYENILSKSQVLTTMLSNDKIADQLAFEYCGMFADPALAYKISKEDYAREQEASRKELEAFAVQQTVQGAQGAEDDDEGAVET